MSKCTYITLVIVCGLLLPSNSLFSQSSSSEGDLKEIVIPSPKELDAMDDSGHPDRSKIVGEWLVRKVTPIYALDEKQDKNTKQAIKEATKILKQKFRNLVINFKADNTFVTLFDGDTLPTSGFYKLSDDKLYFHEMGPGTTLFKFELKKSTLVLKMTIPNTYVDLVIDIELKKI